jgi:hypothetical protein
MTAVMHYHHTGQADDMVIDHYPDGDPSLGVVMVRDTHGVIVGELASELVAWGDES